MIISTGTSLIFTDTFGTFEVRDLWFIVYKYSSSLLLEFSSGPVET